MFLTAERGDGCTPYDSRSDKERVMKRLSIAEILKRNGLELSDVKEQLPDDHKKASQYFEYHVGQDEIIRIESTATSVMEEILHLSVHHQASMFLTILHEIEKPGEQVVIDGDKKKRGSRAVRLASDNPKIRELLLTH